MEKNKSIICSLNAVILALYPFLDIYCFRELPIGIGSILLLITGVISVLFINPNVNNYNSAKWIIALLFVSVLTLLVQGDNWWFSTSLWWHNTIVTLYILVIFITSGSRFDVKLFFKVGIIFSVIASVVCIYQRLMLLATGSFDMFYIQGLVMSRDVDTITRLRPSSFFTEPAHLCICIMPMMYYAIKKERFIAASIIAAGALASGSTTGFLLLGVFMVLFVFSKADKKRKGLFVCLAIVVAALVVKYAPEVMEENIEKINSTEASQSIRIWGGTIVWKFFTEIEIVFGIGLNQLEEYALSNSLYIKNYSGAIIYVFTCYGLLGLAATITFIISLFKRYKSSIGAIVIFLCIFFSDQILFNRHLVYLLVFVECMRMLNVQQSKDLLLEANLKI